jgi:hypothetical protein
MEETCRPPERRGFCKRRFPTKFHAVAKGTPYSWSNRYWYTGTAVWWGQSTYRRANVPGATTDVGYSLKFFE